MYQLQTTSDNQKLQDNLKVLKDSEGKYSYVIKLLYASLSIVLKAV